MALIFIAIDPDTDTEHCPAVFVEEETGDLLFQGGTITDGGILAEVGRHSLVADNESVVWLPARMRACTDDFDSQHRAENRGCITSTSFTMACLTCCQDHRYELRLNNDDRKAEAASEGIQR